jgi:hypothetical protein
MKGFMCHDYWAGMLAFCFGGAGVWMVGNGRTWEDSEQDGMG